jgi:pimeloyl-ACP methyl ester carboxylesterase
MLMALVAPRGLMVHAGYNETAANVLGFEQAYRSAQRVYRLLGKEQNLWLHLRPGEHEPFAGDIEDMLDFFDAVFGRHAFPKVETWVHGYSFDDWRRISGEKIDIQRYPRRQVGDFLLGGKAIASAAAWEQTKPAIRKRISWALGEEPPAFAFPPIPKILGVRGLGGRHWLSPLFNRPTGASEAPFPPRRKMPHAGVALLPFGDHLKGDLFYPLAADGKPKPGKWPVVIWLHPYTYQMGWSAGLIWGAKWFGIITDYQHFDALAEKGFAIFAFDQTGFGTRLQDGRSFYDRYPHWSRMGKILADTRAAIDALAALEEVDASRIYLLGYALGGKLGLLAAALDERPAGVVSVCGFDPLRLDAADKGTEGIGHYSHLHGLMPRLGFFVGQESRVPFDYDEVVSLIAPRPVLLVAPTLDRYARIADVRREIEGPKKVYGLFGREDRLQVETPVDFNRFPPALQQKTFDWLANEAHR